MACCQAKTRHLNLTPLHRSTPALSASSPQWRLPGDEGPWWSRNRGAAAGANWPRPTWHQVGPPKVWRETKLNQSNQSKRSERSQFEWAIWIHLAQAWQLHRLHRDRCTRKGMPTPFSQATNSRQRLLSFKVPPIKALDSRQRQVCCLHPVFSWAPAMVGRKIPMTHFLPQHHMAHILQNGARGQFQLLPCGAIFTSRLKTHFGCGETNLP